MKKLVLLVSVFLLVAGMVAADVTFAPTVTGTTSVTWGLDLKTSEGVGMMNSGFDTANATSLDLGITIDPVDAKGGEGIYGEVTMSGLAVTAKSGADVSVAAPAIDAKLWFSEALYASIFTDAKPNYNYAGPLGELITVKADDNVQAGTWYDADEDYNNAKVFADYGNAGYSFSYMAGDLTVNLDFVSGDKWGKKEDVLTRIKLADIDKGDVDLEPKNGLLSAAELDDLEAKVNALDAGQTKYDYSAYSTPVAVSNNAGTVVTMYEVPVDGDYIQFWRGLVKVAGKDTEGELITSIDTGDTPYGYLYSAAIDVAYTLTDIGTFKAYVLPTHTSKDEMFTNVNFGAEAAIALAAFDMVGLTVGADFAFDGLSANGDEAQWDYELNATVPVKVGDLLTANLKAASYNGSTDSYVATDLAADATVTAAGATVSCAYMVSDFMHPERQSSSYTVSASYPIAVGEGTVTPAIWWGHDMVTPDAGMADHLGLLKVSAVAAIVDNVTFTAEYAGGDIFVAKDAEGDLGAFTFKTEFAY